MKSNLKRQINSYKVMRVLLFLVFAGAYYISLIILKEVTIKIIVAMIGFVALFASKFLIDFLKKKQGKKIDSL